MARAGERPDRFGPLPDLESYFQICKQIGSFGENLAPHIKNERTNRLHFRACLLSHRPQVDNDSIKAYYVMLTEWLQTFAAYPKPPTDAGS